ALFCLGYYYPYPYQNVNWYNFPYVLSSVAGSGQFDSTAPFAGGCCRCGSGW
ncbi:unnamed protein product, partial [Rotaria sp. Silwood1]